MKLVTTQIDERAHHQEQQHGDDGDPQQPRRIEAAERADGGVGELARRRS